MQQFDWYVRKPLLKLNLFISTKIKKKLVHATYIQNMYKKEQNFKELKLKKQKQRQSKESLN